MTTFSQSIIHRVSDPDVDQILVNIDRRVREIISAPAVSAEVTMDVELPDAIVMLVSHGLGRPPVVIVSAPVGATSLGLVGEVIDPQYDRTKQVALRATGMGATVTVSVVML